MGMIALIVLATLGLLGASLSKILAEEFKAWSPWLISWLVGIAVLRLHTSERERYKEEWLAYLQEVPGDIGKLVAASGFVVAAFRISNPFFFRFAAKRMTDVAVSCLALIFLLPFFGLIAAAIVIESRGPIFFTQRRWGRGGKIIRIFKFRSMRRDVGDANGVLRTSEGDARVTRTGLFLRKTNLDELPQLFNILLGDMSLVGPRCDVPGMLAAGRPYEDLVDGYHLRHGVRPGLTGLAQIQGLRGPVFHEELAHLRVAYDIQYVENYSFSLDIKILATTVWQELRGLGPINVHRKPDKSDG